MLLPSRTDGHWDLAARLETGQRTATTNVLIEAFTTDDSRSGGGWAGRDSPRLDGNWFNFGPAADLRPASEQDWEVRTGFWAIEGLTVQNTNTKERIHLSLETPFLQWYARNATVLPSDEIVFQLGDQICIFDRRDRAIGLLARGKGPIVVLNDNSR